MAFKDFLRKQVERSPAARAFQRVASVADPRISEVARRIENKERRKVFVEKMEVLSSKDGEVFEKALEAMQREGVRVEEVVDLYAEIARTLQRSMGANGEVKIKGKPLEGKLLAVAKLLLTYSGEECSDCVSNYKKVLRNGGVKLLVWTGKLVERERAKVPFYLKLAAALAENGAYANGLDEGLDGHVTGAILQIVEEAFHKGGSSGETIGIVTRRVVDIVYEKVKVSEDPYGLLKEAAVKMSRFGGRNLELFVRKEL